MTMTERRAAKRAAVYLRVSSEEQVAGYSLSAQERAAERTAGTTAGRSSPATATKARAPAVMTRPSAPASGS